jgi:hypothetical protein
MGFAQDFEFADVFASFCFILELVSKKRLSAKQGNVSRTFHRSIILAGFFRSNAKNK